MIGLVYHLELEIRTCCALLLETSLSLKFTDFRSPYMICRLRFVKAYLCHVEKRGFLIKFSNNFSHNYASKIKDSNYFFLSLCIKSNWLWIHLFIEKLYWVQIRIIGAVKAYTSHLKVSSFELKLTRILEEELGRLDVSVTHNKMQVGHCEIRNMPYAM